MVVKSCGCTGILAGVMWNHCFCPGSLHGSARPFESSALRMRASSVYHCSASIFPEPYFSRVKPFKSFCGRLWLASCTVVAFPRPLHKSSSPFNIRASRMRTSSTGRSSAPTLTRPILCTIFIPLLTLPKIVCLPSSHGVGASVMKN
jgi:hypothetical protein